jgi:hypothetical protein
MKIAHLILAHKNPKQVERLLNALQHPNFDFYIHLDKKTDRSLFAHLYDCEKIYEIKKRASVYWAGWGTIQATLNGFDEIDLTRYDYINVISGQDFPLKSAETIYQYFLERAGKEFITCESIDKEWKEAASRVRNYHLINWRIPGKFKLEKLVNAVFPKRKFPLDIALVGRANWFTLTPAAIRYSLNFLQKHPELRRYFWYCWGADEFIFSTILFNSYFKTQIVPNVMYVDWTGQTKGHPRILDKSDLQALMNTDKLFARKFDIQVDSIIIDELERFITSKEPTS